MDVEKYRKRLAEKYGQFFLLSLGNEPDRAIGDVYHVDTSKICRIRNRLGIPPYTDKHPERCGRHKSRIVMTFDLNTLGALELEDVLPEFARKFRELKAMMPTKREGA